MYKLNTKELQVILQKSYSKLLPILIYFKQGFSYEKKR